MRKNFFCSEFLSRKICPSWLLIFALNFLVIYFAQKNRARFPIFPFFQGFTSLLSNGNRSRWKIFKIEKQIKRIMVKKKNFPSFPNLREILEKNFIFFFDDFLSKFFSRYVWFNSSAGSVCNITTTKYGCASVNNSLVNCFGQNLQQVQLGDILSLDYNTTAKEIVSFSKYPPRRKFVVFQMKKKNNFRFSLLFLLLPYLTSPQDLSPPPSSPHSSSFPRPRFPYPTLIFR